MNVITIGIVARSLGRVHIRRVLAASALGAAYAVAMQYPQYAVLKNAFARLTLAFALTGVSMRPESGRKWLEGTACLVAGTVFVGGIQKLAGGGSIRGFAAGALLGAPALAWALDKRRRRLEGTQAKVSIRRGGGACVLDALVDTGNRLREPFSGLPVMVAEEGRLRACLPADFDAMREGGSVPEGFRAVAYGAVGAKGTLLCFMPEETKVSFGRGWRRAPDMWVGVYPGRLPGEARALAPSCIARGQTQL